MSGVRPCLPVSFQAGLAMYSCSQTNHSPVRHPANSGKIRQFCAKNPEKPLEFIQILTLNGGF